MTPHAEARLLADIGATYARFCVERVPGRSSTSAVLPCADYPGFTAVVQAYLDSLPAGIHPRHGAVVSPTRSEGDWVRMTNRDWAFSIQEAQRQLDLTTLLVVNNFTALAMSLPRLAPGPPPGRQRRAAEQWRDRADRPGAGLERLGPDPQRRPLGDAGHRVGGHVNFAPSDERELRILPVAWKTIAARLRRAAALGAGAGADLPRAESRHSPAPSRTCPPPEIVRRALDRQRQRLRRDHRVLLRHAGRHGLRPRTDAGRDGRHLRGRRHRAAALGELFDRSPFRERFEAKGRFSNFVARIPTYVLTAETRPSTASARCWPTTCPTRKAATRCSSACAPRANRSRRPNGASPTSCSTTRAPR